MKRPVLVWKGKDGRIFTVTPVTISLDLLNSLKINGYRPVGTFMEDIFGGWQ